MKVEAGCLYTRFFRVPGTSLGHISEGLSMLLASPQYVKRRFDKFTKQ